MNKSTLSGARSTVRFLAQAGFTLGRLYVETPSPDGFSAPKRSFENKWPGGLPAEAKSNADAELHYCVGLGLPESDNSAESPKVVIPIAALHTLASDDPVALWRDVYRTVSPDSGQAWAESLLSLGPVRGLVADYLRGLATSTVQTSAKPGPASVPAAPVDDTPAAPSPVVALAGEGAGQEQE